MSEVEQVIGLQCPIELQITPEGGAVIRQDQTGMMGDQVEIYINDQNGMRSLAQALLRALGDVG